MRLSRECSDRDIIVESRLDYLHFKFGRIVFTLSVLIRCPFKIGGNLNCRFKKNSPDGADYTLAYKPYIPRVSHSHKAMFKECPLRRIEVITGEQNAVVMLFKRKPV